MSGGGFSVAGPEEAAADAYDTPESVAEKAKNVGVIAAMANHYLLANHAGDYFDCELCREEE